MQERAGAHLEQIEAFAAVSEHHGIAAAARSLGRDASVISRRLDALEARLGVRLLSRTTRRVALTEAGVAYLRRVQAILGELSAADAEASEGASTPRGVLRVSLPPAFAARWVAPWLAEFTAAYPLLRLEFLHGNHFVDLVAGGFDAAVRIGEMEDSSLVARRLARFNAVLCASPAYLDRAGTPARPEDLEHHACLGYPAGRFWPDWRLRMGDARVTQRVSGPILSDDNEGLLIACIAGAGIMPVAEFLIVRELAEGRLVRVLPDWRFDYEAAVQIVLPPGRLVPAKTRAFIERLTREFTPEAPWNRVRAR